MLLGLSKKPVKGIPCSNIKALQNLSFHSKVDAARSMMIHEMLKEVNQQDSYHCCQNYKCCDIVRVVPN